MSLKMISGMLTVRVNIFLKSDMVYDSGEDVHEWSFPCIPKTFIDFLKFDVGDVH
jgi:hypothetical protein